MSLGYIDLTEYPVIDIMWGDSLDEMVFSVTIASLLHDIGKLLHFAGDDRRAQNLSGSDFIKQFTNDENMIHCIQYHRREDIQIADLKDDSPAYIVYIANNVSSCVNNKNIDTSPSKRYSNSGLLCSIFNLLNNNTGTSTYLPGRIDKNIKYPQEVRYKGVEREYKSILADFKDQLSTVQFNSEYIHSLIELCELYLSYIPSFDSTDPISDISLFDHCKVTAAVASCIYLYLKHNGRTNYRAELFDHERSFYDEKAFCLFSVDISGIQQFIYTISSKGALKGMRSRSFYLEILVENIVDEILQICSISRANLLYTGGGHLYMLIPNVKTILLDVQKAMKTINRQLMSNFETSLFAAYGFEECSANELMSRTDNPESYVNIFRQLSSQISRMKMRRYSADDIRLLNATRMENDDRECTVCGSSTNLYDGTDTVCSLCMAMSDISSILIKPEVVLAILNEKPSGKYIPMLSANGDQLFFCPMHMNDAKEMLQKNPENVVRLYCKNLFRSGLSQSVNLWMGDYASQNGFGQLKTFEELAERSEGIKRIGVLRADVDNLGVSFMKGFIRENDKDSPYRFLTISRTTALSRSLSLFFKYYINDLMENPIFSLSKKTGKRNIVIVYSGGDDLFIVGAWDEVLSAAVDMHNAFERYTQGSLTISAGFAVFDSKFPITLMAKNTAELEDRAKQHQYMNGSKNSISLFGLEPKEGALIDRNTYDWKTFINKVLGEKYNAIKELNRITGEEKGSTFLYNILFFLRQCEDEKINIARLAYLLARHEPTDKADNDAKSVYTSFSNSIYKWSLCDADRQQMITAIIIYIYLIREKGEEK
ncbi:MAG: type III-A CRISPR-associated protein Cas10/Csm1 [Clostridiaceae bacterium]|nr:type III-A CRISPR-associated protein Cas10/Csm1 [Clostridiaceae bacterium]